MYGYQRGSWRILWTFFFTSGHNLLDYYRIRKWCWQIPVREARMFSTFSRKETYVLFFPLPERYCFIPSFSTHVLIIWDCRCFQLHQMKLARILYIPSTRSHLHFYSTKFRIQSILPIETTYSPRMYANDRLIPNVGDRYSNNYCNIRCDVSCTLWFWSNTKFDVENCIISYEFFPLTVDKMCTKQNYVHGSTIHHLLKQREWRRTSGTII